MKLFCISPVRRTRYTHFPRTCITQANHFSHTLTVPPHLTVSTHALHPTSAYLWLTPLQSWFCLPSPGTQRTYLVISHIVPAQAQVGIPRLLCWGGTSRGKLRRKQKPLWGPSPRKRCLTHRLPGGSCLLTNMASPLMLICRKNPWGPMGPLTPMQPFSSPCKA